MPPFAKKDEDDDQVSILFDRAQVLQETRLFNEAAVSSRKCRNLIARVLGLLYQGETLATHEATDVFFATTKLFQNKDPALRQIVYLLVKELADLAEDVMMATSSLTKDINTKPEDLFSGGGPLTQIGGFKFGSSSSVGGALQAFSGGNTNAPGSAPGSLVGSSVNHRANALRALCKVTDASLLQAIERFVKQMILDKDGACASSALASAYHYHLVAKDVVRRWSNEVQEVLLAKDLQVSRSSPFALGQSSSPTMAQYHALGLLYRIRQGDRMSVEKLLQQLTAGNDLRHPWAVCMLIRLASSFIEEERKGFAPGTDIISRPERTMSSYLYDYLKSQLSNRNEMVAIEAARAVCSLVSVRQGDNGLSDRQIQPAVSALQLFLSSAKPVLRFAALRTLNELAATHSGVVATCNVDMENLISDSNRSIATFAITTLLKTGLEQNVDRLMKQITPFMAEISDEFKIVVIESIRALGSKFPSKHPTMITFLSGVLRDEGGYEYKRCIIEALFEMIRSEPKSIEVALSHLCEFIEDCEYSKLAVRVLYLMAQEGPKAKEPKNYIRYIYNRVILENSNVRAAAVTALAHFGSKLGPEVSGDIKVLLARCLNDNDDEVRDRATVYLSIMEDKGLIRNYIKRESLPDVAALEAKLLAYRQDEGAWALPVDLSSIPQVSREEEEQQRIRLKSAQEPTISSFAAEAESETSVPGTQVQDRDSQLSSARNTQSQQDITAGYLEKTATIPALAKLGDEHIKSTQRPVELTERDLEYLVSCIKHVFQHWVVFEFLVTNTLNDSVLDNATIIMTSSDDDLSEGLEYAFSVPASRLEYNVEGTIYVAYKRVNGASPCGSFAVTLKYLAVQRDPVSGDIVSNQGLEDEYGVEDIDVHVGDYIVPTFVPNFEELWESLGEQNSVVETYQLSGIKPLSAAVPKIIDALGMRPAQGTERVDPTSPSHLLLLSGLYSGSIRAAVRCRMLAADESQGVTLELSVRSEDEEASQIIANGIE